MSPKPAEASGPRDKDDGDRDRAMPYRHCLRPGLSICSAPARSARDKTHLFELEDHLVRAVVHVHILGLDAQFRVIRHVVGV